MMRKLSGGRLLIATHNEGKLQEIVALLEGLSIEVSSAKALNLPEPEETETTFIGNARIKAHAAAQASGLPSLADDSGITVDVLDGQPGVYTADWAATTHGRDFDVAMRKTWDLAVGTRILGPYRAQFRCTFVLAWPDGHDEVFEGSVGGVLVWPGKGMNGHGYDPMFRPDGYDLTFGEMDR